MLKDGKLMVGNIEILNLIFLKAKNVVILKIDWIKPILKDKKEIILYFHLKENTILKSYKKSWCN